jgi:hypothetical protein
MRTSKLSIIVTTTLLFVTHGLRAKEAAFNYNGRLYDGTSPASGS